MGTAIERGRSEMNKISLSPSLIVCLVASLFSIFGFSHFAFAQAESEQTVEIVLHKRITNEQDSTKTYVNNGTGQFDQEWLDKSQPLNGAQFQVFDASEAYLTARKAGQNAAAFMKAYYQRIDSQSSRSALLNDAKVHYGDAVREVETSEIEITGERQKGIAKIVGLTEYQDAEVGRYGAYLIIETEANRQLGVDLDQYARPIMVMLPDAKPDGQSIIHLFPKNVAYARDPYFFKFAKHADGQEFPLAGARFVLYQRDEAGEKSYLAKEKFKGKNQWLKVADPAVSEEIANFSSDATGLVMTTTYTLGAGTYYFEEITTVSGYEIDAAVKAIKVEIPDRWKDDNGKEQAVLLNGEALDKVTAGKVSQLAAKSQKPRIYNKQKSPTEPTDPSKPKDPSGKDPGSTGTSQFPSTGEAKAAFSILGFIIVVMTLYYWKKRKEA